MFLISLHISCQVFYSYPRKQSRDFCTLRCCCTNQNKSKQVCAHPSVTNNKAFLFCFFPPLWQTVILSARWLLSVTSASFFLFRLPLTPCGNCRGGGSSSAHPSQRNPTLGGHVWAFVHLATTCLRPLWQDARERGRARSSALSQGDCLSHSTRRTCTHIMHGTRCILDFKRKTLTSGPHLNPFGRLYRYKAAVSSSRPQLRTRLMSDYFQRPLGFGG